MNHILTVGNINYDIIVSIPTYPSAGNPVDAEYRETNIGGSAVNTGRLLADAGIKTEIATVTGRDDLGQIIQEQLANQFDNTQITEKLPETTRVYCMIRDNGPEFINVANMNSKFSHKIVPESKWKRIEHLHITSFDTDTVHDFIDTATEYGLSISFNPSLNFHGQSAEYVPMFTDCDIIFVNEHEVDKIPIDTLRDEKTEVVVTKGSKETVYYASNGSTYTKSPEEVEQQQIHDTLGAGDAFIAGFLQPWLTESATAECCLKYGHCLAKRAITEPGVLQTVPDEAKFGAL